MQESVKNSDDPMTASIFWLDGQAHRSCRAAIISIFTPKAIATRHLPNMQRAADELVGGLHRRGRGRLDKISFALAVAVTSEIVGLTESRLHGMNTRIELFAGDLPLPVAAALGSCCRRRWGTLPVVALNGPALR